MKFPKYTYGQLNITPKKPYSEYKRIYGFAKDYDIGTKFVEEGGDMYLDKSGVPFFDSNNPQSQQEKEVPKSPYNLHRFVYKPTVLNLEDSPQRNRYNPETMEFTHRVPAKFRKNLSKGMKLAKKDLQNYYMFDLGMQKKDVIKNVRDDMKQLRIMKNIQKSGFAVNGFSDIWILDYPSRKIKNSPAVLFDKYYSRFKKKVLNEEYKKNENKGLVSKSKFIKNYAKYLQLFKDMPLKKAKNEAYNKVFEVNQRDFKMTQATPEHSIYSGYKSFEKYAKKRYNIK